MSETTVHVQAANITGDGVEYFVNGNIESITISAARAKRIFAELTALREEKAALRERVAALKEARNWLQNIYMNATSDDAGEDFRYYFEVDEILAIETVLDATAEGSQFAEAANNLLETKADLWRQLADEGGE